MLLYSWWKSRVQGQNKMKSRLYASPFSFPSLSQLIMKHALVWKCKRSVSRKFSEFIVALKLYPRTVYIFCISSVKKPTPYPATFLKESLNMLFFTTLRGFFWAARPHISFCSPTGLINLPFSIALRTLSIHQISILV